MVTFNITYLNDVVEEHSLDWTCRIYPRVGDTCISVGIFEGEITPEKIVKLNSFKWSFTFPSSNALQSFVVVRLEDNKVIVKETELWK